MKKFQIPVKKGVGQKMDATDRPTYDEWMRRVDALLRKYVGLSYADLVDCTWMEWYEKRLRPIRAANRALRQEQE